ncbi:hypothetical protein PHSY_000562 [Pseudozyma hubeiensis SY62]|uniref:Uncharacterized protein n=1 Tax=Pseudozyma hubeiensis (strain SY62) TaxID=1305764 RepID=R9NWU5_PSEHS|nr:hypothetical protein PHSY_000562 [Pseudozyma hubeiensis SY62]GAC93001.1 hypothetical protein PHSY_000562 [Pseudozyma hubeiensis SY62]
MHSFAADETLLLPSRMNGDLTVAPICVEAVVEHYHHRYHHPVSIPSCVRSLPRTMRPFAPTSSFARAVSASSRTAASPIATRLGLAPNRNFTTTLIRRDDQSRAKAGGVSASSHPRTVPFFALFSVSNPPIFSDPYCQVKSVMNRPEITPLFLFTGGMICLALFFGGKHLVKDKELRLDHKQQNRLATQTDQLDFDAMAKVAQDPDGKLTKDAIEEDKKRQQRLEGIREEKKEKANDKV